MTQRAEQWTKIVIKKTKLVFNCLLMDFPPSTTLQRHSYAELSFVEVIDLAAFRLALNDAKSDRLQHRLNLKQEQLAVQTKIAAPISYINDPV